MVSIRRPCELLQVDLCGPMHVKSIRGKFYTHVTVDDLSRFTWIDFLKKKEKV